jgi:heme-degrading monooxygenase HmoA
MIVRIVQLPIEPGSLKGEKFEALFQEYKSAILDTTGCQRVQLLAADICYFTYSWWDSETDLNAYRDSTTFGVVWPKTKALFSGKPQAWTCNSLEHMTK